MNDEPKALAENQSPVIVVSFDDDYADRFISAVGNLCPIVHVSPLMRTVSTTIESLGPRIVIFDIQTIKTEEHSVLDLMEQMSQSHPEMRKIGLGYRSEPAQLIAAMKAGACDFLDRNSSPEEIREAIIRQFQYSRAALGNRRGRVLAIVSGRENDGELEFAVNLSTYLAQSRPGQDVLLLDYNLENSRFEVDFDIEATYSVRDALDELLTLDKAVLSEVLPRHSSGLRLLPLVSGDHHNEDISPQELATLLSTLKSLFGAVVVNAGCLRHRVCRPYVIPLCDELIAVCSQRIASVKACHAILSDEAINSQDAADLKLVISKYSRDIALTADQISERLGLPVSGTLPAAYSALSDAHNLGKPLNFGVYRSAYGRAIAQIGNSVLPDRRNVETRQPAEPRFGFHNLLPSLFRRSKVA